MKEKYFIPGIIHKKSLEILKKIEKYREKHKFIFIPERSALIILDMQKFFLEESSHAFIPAAPLIIPLINKLLEIYASKKLLIIFTQHLNSQEDAKLMSKWWKDLIKKEDPLSKITEELDTSKGIVLQKTQYDAFWKTPLEEILREKKINQIVICGVMTHLCCESTARSAFIRGLEVFFTIDGTATYNEDFHLATLLNLSHGFAVPIFIKEILSTFKNEN